MKKLTAAVLAAIMPLSAQAGGWEYSVTPYLWLPSISVENSSFPTGGGSSDVGPTNYLDALDFGFMIAGEARNDNLVIKGDYIYLDFSVDEKDVEFDRVSGSASASLTGKVPTLMAGINVIHTDNYTMDVLAGWRRADLDLSIDATRNVIWPIFGAQPSGIRLLALDESYDDFLVGINGNLDFSDSNWSMPYYADIGAGDSDLTWQAMVGLDYAFDSWKLHLNYRHLAYDFGDLPVTVPLGGSIPIQNFEMVFSGPTIGAKFEF